MASVQKRGKDSWLLVVEAGLDAKGDRQKRTRTVKARNKTEAKLLLAEFIVEVEAGEYIKPEKMLFSAFVNEWREKFGQKNLAISTLLTYESHLKNQIMPTFGHKKLDEIKTFHIVNFMNEISKDTARMDGRDGSLSGYTQDFIYRILKNIFSRATEWKLIKVNPVNGVTKPKTERTKMKYYDEDEAQQVIDALYTEKEIWKFYFLGAMLGGFRRGELVALEWDQVDFDNNTFDITQNITVTRNGVPTIGKPKNRSSEGIVVMPAWYMEELKRYRLKWLQNKLEVGDKWLGGDHQFVFHAGFGKPLHSDTPTAQWRRFINRHSLKFIRLHDLRHTSATLLIEAGANMKAIQERLRHADYKTTANTYAHVTKKVSTQTAEMLDKFKPTKKNG